MRGWGLGIRDCLRQRRYAPAQSLIPSPQPLFRPGVEGQGVQLAAHAALERGVNHLVLGHPRLARERGGADHRPVMVPVAGQVLDVDIGVGKGLPEQGLQLVGGDRQGCAPVFVSGALGRRGAIVKAPWRNV